MKPKELLYHLGFKPRPRVYGHEVVSIPLETDGPIPFAQWLHPRYPRHHFSQATVDTLRRYIRPGDFCIDIGAHTGDSTLPIALAAGPTGNVLALEPNRYVFPILQKNAELCAGRARIVPLNFAAAAEDCRMQFEYSDAGFCNGGSHEGISNWRLGHPFKLEVEGRNLQAFLEAQYPDDVARVRYIKVDAEGHDHRILETLADLLKHSRPFIKAEVFKFTRRPQRQAFLDFLTGLGYRVHRIESDTQLEGPLLTSANLMERRHYDLFCAAHPGLTPSH